MSTIKKMFGKVADLAKKVVLVGAIVGGVSLVANATEASAGPTIEKAKLETVNVNLESVVAAITKVDPDWVKGLPMLKKTKDSSELYWFNTTADGTPTTPLQGNPECEEQTGDYCAKQYEESHIDFSTTPISVLPGHENSEDQSVRRGN